MPPVTDLVAEDQICSRPECFQVSEIHLSGISASEAEPASKTETRAPITFGVLYKRNLSTLSAVLILKKMLGKKIRYGGLKDAKAISWQFISFEGSAGPIRRKDLCFLPLTKRFTHMSTKEVWGNAFAIHLTGVADTRSVAESFIELSKKPLPAFYGPQRFGRESRDTHRIGLHILRKEYDEAVRIILSGKNGWYERILQDTIKNTKTSEQALTSLPAELIKLFINAYQAHVFNRALLKFVSTQPKKVILAPSGPNGLPLPKRVVLAQNVPQKEGFYTMGLLPGTKLRKMEDEFSEIEIEALSQDGLAPEDFSQTPIGEITGSLRQLYFWMVGPNYLPGPDSLWLRFKLHRGMYATVVLSFLSRSLFHKYLDT